jgi:hypothetical protein
LVLYVQSMMNTDGKRCVKAIDSSSAKNRWVNDDGVKGCGFLFLGVGLEAEMRRWVLLWVREMVLF